MREGGGQGEEEALEGGVGAGEFGEGEHPEGGEGGQGVEEVPQASVFEEGVVGEAQSIEVRAHAVQRVHERLNILVADITIFEPDHHL